MEAPRQLLGPDRWIARSGSAPALQASLSWRDDTAHVGAPCVHERQLRRGVLVESGVMIDVGAPGPSGIGSLVLAVVRPDGDTASSGLFETPAIGEGAYEGGGQHLCGL